MGAATPRWNPNVEEFQGVKELFSKYGMKARLFPALLCVPPFMLIKHLAIDPFVDPSLTSKLWLVAAGDVSLASVLIYLLAQVNRFVSKVLFEARSEFPTTRMLLPSNKELSEEFRRKLTAKAQTDFNLSLPSLADEIADTPNAKTRIKEIVGLIINRVGNGRLLLQHNIEYGFVRNLIGGAVTAVLTSIAGIILFGFVIHNKAAFIVSILLAICYSLPLLFSKPLLSNFGRAYASILFREYAGEK